MPYVWVDPSEMECDGSCSEATDLRGAVLKAFELLDAADYDGAHAVLRAALGPKPLTAREQRIAKFVEWTKAGRPMPFWSWERMS